MKKEYKLCFIQGTYTLLVKLFPQILHKLAYMNKQGIWYSAKNIPIPKSNELTVLKLFHLYFFLPKSFLTSLLRQVLTREYSEECDLFWLA
jgi:hypothetical protein